jgi:hypothetical protein
MRRQVPLFITFASGLVMIVQYYFATWNWLGDMLTEWFQIITAFAYILGAASLMMVNGRRIQRRSPGWIYNLVLLLSLALTLGLGLLVRKPGYTPIDEGMPFDWLFRFVFTPLSATTFSLVAFFIASAAFRAFKAKSIEATLLLVTAFLVMLLRVPLGEQIWIHTPLLNHIDIGDLVDRVIMGGFNTAGQRAILLGASIGLISISLKIILGIERSYLGGD